MLEESQNLSMMGQKGIIHWTILALHTLEKQAPKGVCPMDASSLDLLYHFLWNLLLIITPIGGSVFSSHFCLLILSRVELMNGGELGATFIAVGVVQVCLPGTAIIFFCV